MASIAAFAAAATESYIIIVATIIIVINVNDNDVERCENWPAGLPIDREEKSSR